MKISENAKIWKNNEENNEKWKINNENNEESVVKK